MAAPRLALLNRLPEFSKPSAIFLAEKLRRHSQGEPALTMEEEWMKSRWVVSSVAIINLAMPAMRVGAQTAPPVPAVFTWSGQLIAFDVDARAITVKAPVRGDQAVIELREFIPGDRILLTWSGYGSQGVAIARAVRFDPVSNWNQPFTFPAEFVKYEAGSQFLTFTAEAPDTNFAELKSLKPGEWITGTARHRPSNDSEAAAAVTP